VKYYIVGPPLNGHQEYLFAIATKTLGNGNRSGEIFNINKGRTQPDGEALTDPAVLRPGWLLLLPADEQRKPSQVGGAQGGVEVGWYLDLDRTVAGQSCQLRRPGQPAVGKAFRAGGGFSIAGR
jgi:hypothetical protein